jgi:asparagine synthase (glutamine-hydrolysing)
LSWDKLHIAADAALYNADELRRVLGDSPPEASDAELIGRAYSRWGTACLERLDGDFAFALWDQQNQRLFCARDPLGVRPFFYRWDGRSLAWASEVKALAADPEYSAAPDEAMVGEFLLGWSDFPNAAATFYRGIQQLPGGHRLMLANGCLQVERYWDIDPAEHVQPHSFQESVEEFRALFAEAVQKRLTSAGRVGILISGGLDSTAIGSWAEHWANCRSAPHYVSYVMPDARGDERSFLRAFEEKYSRAVHYLEIQQTRILEGIESGTDLRENAFLDHGWDIIRRSAERLENEQCTVVASGLGGDNVFPNPGPAYFIDMANRGGWRAGWEAYQQTCSFYGVSRRTFLGPTLRRLLPGAVKRQAKRWLQREIPEWVRPEFARQSGLLARVRQPLPRRGFSSHTQEEDYGELTSGRVALMLGYFDRVGAAAGFEFRHPFFDPTLVRFTLLAPLEHKIRHGETKLLLRQALEGILPEVTRQRRFKGSPGPFLTRWARTHEAGRWRALAEGARYCSAYVKAAQLRECVNRFLEGEDELLKPAWNLLSLELWLRNSFAA